MRQASRRARRTPRPRRPIAAESGTRAGRRGSRFLVTNQQPGAPGAVVSTQARGMGPGGIGTQGGRAVLRHIGHPSATVGGIGRLPHSALLRLLTSECGGGLLEPFAQRKGVPPTDPVSRPVLVGAVERASHTRVCGLRSAVCGLMVYGLFSAPTMCPTPAPAAASRPSSAGSPAPSAGAGVPKPAHAVRPTHSK